MAKKAKKGTLFGKPREEVVKHPGAFSAKAKRAHMSTDEYANKVLKEGSRASAETKKQAALAKAFKTMREKKLAKKSTKSSPPATDQELAQGYKKISWPKD